MPVVVVTDSSACLPEDLREAYGIRVVPLHVLLGEREYRDGVDTMPDDLSGATTSGPSRAEFEDAFARAVDASEGDGVVGVVLSRHLSSTWETARSVADTSGGAVRIVDSGSAAMGVGFAALAAAKAAAAGASLRVAYDRAVDAAARTQTMFVVDKLDHLRRGGRIGAATALLGTALAIKPILHIVDGRLAPKEKTRTIAKAVVRLVESAAATAVDGGAVAVHHRHAPERAREVADALRARLGDDVPVFASELDCVLGVHVGPGAVGVVATDRWDARRGPRTR